MAEFDEVVREMFWNQGVHPCCCMGPMDGNPVCPCNMKYVKIVDGHYIQITDMGKVGDREFTTNENFTGATVNITGWDVVITGVADDSRVTLMKAMRECNRNLDMNDVKDMIVSFPVLFKDDVSEDEAEETAAKLEAAGAIVVLR